MKNSISVLTLFSIIIILSGCQVNEKQGVPKLQFSEFESLLHLDNDTVYVINFWATWCKPCVKELPDFEKLNKEYLNDKVKVVLVSLDFPNKHDELLLPFIEKHQLKSKIIHLTDVDANQWINKVNPNWSGAIPATLIYKGDKREFFEGSMNFEELKQIVEQKLK